MNQELSLDMNVLKYYKLKIQNNVNSIDDINALMMLDSFTEGLGKKQEGDES